MAVGLARISVGAQAHRNTTARFEGVARFGFFLQAMQGDKGCRGGGTSRAPSPTDLLPWGSCFSRFFIQFSSLKQGAGSAFLCDQNLSSCSPNSRPQDVSSYTATLQDIRFGIISLYLSRKSPLLLHKKCNNCRNVVKLKYKSFVCTNYDVINCAVSHIRS